MCAFRVQPSLIEGAGDGLFSLVPIPSGSVFRVSCRHFAPAPHDRGENLACYVNEQDDRETPCVFDGEKATIERVWQRIDPQSFVPRYALGHLADPFMKANDLAWPASSMRMYHRAMQRNTIEFILSFDALGRVDGIFAHFMKDVPPNVEIGATYGWAYWVES